MPTRESPLVTVGLPVFNGGSLLRRALGSLVSQDYQELEIVVRDNASTDETPSICREFAARDRRVRYFRNDANVGPMANFARTLDDATGHYFMWAAHDDLWESDYVRRLEAALGRHPTAVLAAGHAVFEAPDGSSLGAESRAPRDDSEPWRELLDGHATHWIYGLFVRERLARLTQRLWTRRPWGGDMVWLMELATSHAVAGDDGAVIHKIMKPSPYEPQTPRAVVAWQLWYGRALLGVVLASPLPAGARLRAAGAVAAYWARYVNARGIRYAARVWAGALRDVTLGRAGRGGTT